MYPKRLWAGFALPGVVWLVLLFLVPFYAVIAVAFGNVDALLQTPIPIWNPLDWNTGWMEQVLGDLAPGGVYWGAVVRTIQYVALSLFFSLLIGYPVAYYIARHARRTKNLLLILLIMPFWISYLMRMLAWVNLLAADGYATRFLDFTRLSSLAVHLGLLSQQDAWLNGQSFTVVAALVYGYIPYFILPLYASLDRIDKSLLEAGRDLGGSPFSTFLHVTLPLSKTGLLGGAVLIALPMFGDYYTPNIVSGAPTTSMIGNQIDLYFHGGPQPTIGAAITIIMSLFLVILMGYYMWSIHRAQKEVQTL
jgi:ABC-type spermidine/putrescine transport system permease subunit I